MHGVMRRLIPVIILALLGLGWVAFTAHEVRRLSPPHSAQNLRGFLTHMPAPDRLTKIDVAGQEYLLVTGVLPSSITLPSGPPQYVFDTSGRLVDWSMDCDDDPDFVAKWNSNDPGTQLTSDEAIDLFGG